MANTLKLGNGKWATGKDTVLSFSDTNNNFKPLPFSFSRASSATVVNQSGLIETVQSGTPRIDFLGNTKGALLLEPSRTNIVPYSQTFTGWSLTNALETPNALISPDGNLNASKFVTNNTGVDIKYVNIPVVQNTTYTYSFYCNYVGGLGLQGRFYDNTNGANIEYYDYMNQLEAGKWKRVTRTFTTPSGCSNIQIWYLAASSSQPVTAYYWGAQLEVGSYATSYIPTSGQSGGVTRVRDLSDTQNLSHVIGQTEGVIFYDAILIHKSTGTSEDLFSLSIDDGSATNGFFINNYNNTLTVLLKSGGSTSFSNNSFNPTEGARYKLGFAYKQNDFALYINGNQIATDSSGTVPSLNQITFGNYYDNRVSFQDSVKVNDFKFYNTRLSNAELQALTTI